MPLRFVFPKRRGFTLLELMIVVAIIGLLALLAVPSFLTYLKESKLSEVSLNLKSIGDGAATYYQSEHYSDTGFPVSFRQFPTRNGTLADTTSSLVPLTVPKATKHSTTSADWGTSPWRELKFSILKPHYYQYTFSPDNPDDSFSALAKGDLDGDNIESSFAIEGQLSPDGAISLTPTLDKSPGNRLE